jgi:hypothetical protein
MILQITEGRARSSPPEKSTRSELTTYRIHIVLAREHIEICTILGRAHLSAAPWPAKFRS